MNLQLVADYIKFILESDDGYFYTIISDHAELIEYEIMIANKRFKIRPRNKDELWDEYTLSDKAISTLSRNNISFQRIGVELEQSIINSGLFHYMRFEEIQQLVGKPVMKEGAEHMVTFANLFKKTINKQIRKHYGKFALIKQDE